MGDARPLRRLALDHRQVRAQVREEQMLDALVQGRQRRPDGASRRVSEQFSACRQRRFSGAVVRRRIVEVGHAPTIGATAGQAP